MSAGRHAIPLPPDQGVSMPDAIDDAAVSHSVQLVVDDCVATVTLNRPDRLNAAVPEMFEALQAVVRQLARDESRVRVVVITGAGKAFCAGADLANRSTDDAQGLRLRQAASIITDLRLLPQITVGAINGACAGFGLSLAAACDIRVATASAVFTTAYLNAGLPGDFGGMWNLSRLIGRGRAAHMYLLPNRITAADAYAWGLLSEPPMDAFKESLAAVIERLTSAAPLALAAIKQNLQDLERLDLPQYLDEESQRHARVRASDDASEAAQALLDKRTPRFRGR